MKVQCKDCPNLCEIGEEALDEADMLFSGWRDGDHGAMKVVCDECFKKYMVSEYGDYSRTRRMEGK